MSIYPVYFAVLPTVANGEPVGLAVDENGKLIVTSAGGDGLTDAELRATPVPVSGTVTADSTPSSSIVAATVTATVTPAALASQACRNLLLQADPDNAVDALIGDASSQPIQLAPGASVMLPVSNANLIYVATASSTADINSIALV